LTKNPLIYVVSHYTLPGVGVLFGKLRPVGLETDYQQTSISKTLRVIKQCQLKHRPFGCSAVIATSYVWLELRWTTLFSTAIAKLYNCSD